MLVRKIFFNKALFLMFAILLFAHSAYTQSGTIDFEDSKWNSVEGYQLYNGGPNNTLTDQAMGVDFIIGQGIMWVENVTSMGRMLFFSPYINPLQEYDESGRVVIRFSSLKEMVKIDVTHDPTPMQGYSYEDAYMSVKFYKDYDPNNALYSEIIPYQGSFREVEYLNDTEGIKMVIISTKWMENDIDNIEFADMGSGSVITGTFDFNDGTDQGWTMQGAFDEDGDGPFSSNFVFDWEDQVNYSNVPFSDPIGDNKGSLEIYTSSGHGISNAGATWWAMQYHSPDLTSNSTWQSVDGYTVEIADGMSTNETLYCNLYVKVYDLDQAKDRYFYNGQIQALTHYSSQSWNHFEFDWSAISTFPDNYFIKEIFVNLWGKMSKGANGGVYLDNVSPIPGTQNQVPTAPSNLTLNAISSSEINLSWQDNSDNETGFKIERKTGSEGSGSPAGIILKKSLNPKDEKIVLDDSWTQITTVSANQTSYTDDGLSPNTTYYYRIRAYNSVGNSSYSNEVSTQTEEGGTYIQDFNQFPAYPYNTAAYKQGGAFVGCGPTTGAMILGYFQHVYNLPDQDGLLTDPGQGVDEGLNTAWALHGSEYMQTQSNGFGSQYLIKSGLEDYAEDQGYEVEVMIHVSPTYSSDSDSWDDYGNYGEAWTNDGYFWQMNPGGDWEIDPDDFCDFADSVFALNIPIFLTIDTDMDQSGDHWVPMVGYDRNSEKYAYYDTYSQTLQWADIHYALAAGTLYDNSIVFVRTVGYVADNNLPSAPTNLVAHLIPQQVHLTWEDNSDDETGFIIERKISPAFPSVWNKIDTLEANVTSYQTDVPSLFSQTFYFRVSAFNDYGNSPYSNIDTVKAYLSLISLTISSPVGGEEWAPGSVHDITWSSFSSVVAYKINKVTIRYSIDGGSNWISPPIAENIDNSGSYSWTVPNTESDNCIIKVEDASDGSPYDLSNSPFTIGEPVTPVLSVDPDTLDFGISLDELSFDITNIGGGTLTWDVSETPDKLWITSLDPSSGSGDNPVTVTVDRSQLSGNSDTGLLKITSNGGNQEVTVLITQQQVSLPGEWDFTETGSNATVVLPTEANPNIDGTPLINGDYIGVFTPAGLCCGYAQWQEANLSLTVWGDDSQTGEIDGFQSGEVINYRVYRLNESKEWSTVTVAYSQGTGSYTTDAFMVLSQFEATDAAECTVDLAQGWNMFSINLDPLYPQMDSVMSDIKDKVVLIKDGNGNTYVPDYGINNIGSIDFRWGYKGYLNETATLVVRGQKADPSTPINLESGWSIVSFLPDTAMDAVQALESISDELVIAKNGDGDTYVPAYSINTIGNMEPGQGYKVYLSAAATLVYPGGSNPKIIPDILYRKISQSNSNKGIQHFQFTSHTGQNCTVVIPSSIEPQYKGGSLLAAGDEIGVFNSAGLCCGAVVWDEENAALTVWGDDVQTPDTIDGFLENDTLRFKIWDSSDNEEYAALASFENETDCVYHVDGYGVLTELAAQTGTGIENSGTSMIPEEFIMKQAYPNPFNPETTIEFHLPKKAQVRLIVYDMIGREVCCLVQKTLPAGVHRVNWEGRDQNGQPMASGMYVYRIVVRLEDGSGKTMVQVKKMIFMK